MSLCVQSRRCSILLTVGLAVAGGLGCQNFGERNASASRTQPGSEWGSTHRQGSMAVLGTGERTQPEAARHSDQRGHSADAMPMKLKRQDEKAVNTAIAGWAERPKMGALQMIEKYGQPHEATEYRVVWHNTGPFKRISVLNLETPHDFPLPHVDFLEHTIVYDVPQDKVGDLIAFDGSSTINRTVGELSARCDLEGHNVLTLNLDHDIVTGKHSVESAREAFGDIVGQDVKGEKPAYVEALQFAPHDRSRAEFPDTPVIPGSPRRAATEGTSGAVNSGSAVASETLATIIAIDLNEVLAAAHAQTENLSPGVKEFATMLQRAHGDHMVKTMQLGLQHGVTPVITPAVEAMQKKGAKDLALLIPLDDMAFEKAYVEAMIAGHEQALLTIDQRMGMDAGKPELTRYLTDTRTSIAGHLERAKQLKGDLR